MELKCVAQQYAWGKLGLASQVAQLMKNAHPQIEIQQDKPYAELWMGTHPNGPSIMKDSNQHLDELIKANPEVLGDKCRQQFGDNLPFLFKILSVNKALSIQAHPNKELASALHKDRPNIYKDPNHKPEMAIALTNFEGLCGFRPLKEIKSNLEYIAQLRHVVGEDVANCLLDSTEDVYEMALKKCFTSLMQCDKMIINEKVSELQELIAKKSVKQHLDNLFLRLCDQFPGDVGCFVIYFLNVVRLSPGEAMFLGPNVPHAYLSGDCVECMACSDNVVRAGLTPKLIDVEVLCNMLEYVCTKGEKSVKFSYHAENENSILYEAPVPDFSVAKVLVDSQNRSLPRSSASILICIEGEGTFNAYAKESTEYYSSGKLLKGTVLFLRANDVLEFVAQKKMICYQAFC